MINLNEQEAILHNSLINSTFVYFPQLNLEG